MFKASPSTELQVVVPALTAGSLSYLPWGVPVLVACPTTYVGSNCAKSDLRRGAGRQQPGCAGRWVMGECAQ